MPLDRTINAFEDQIELLGTMNIGKMWDRMLGEFLDHWAQLDRQGLSDADMEREMLAFIEGLSEKPMEDLARTSSSVAYNQGRAVTIAKAKARGEVQYAVRSEILDIRTCDACANLDGLVVEIGSSDYQEYMPPAKCFGGDRCRGFYVAVPRDMAA